MFSVHAESLDAPNQLFLHTLSKLVLMPKWAEEKGRKREKGVGQAMKDFGSVGVSASARMRIRSGGH